MLSNHEDLQVRVLQGVARAFEDGSNELCMREGLVPAGAARMFFYERAVVSILATIMNLLGRDAGLKAAVGLVKEATRAHDRGEAVPLDRPKG
jgi:hypothetical protein